MSISETTPEARAAERDLRVSARRERRRREGRPVWLYVLSHAHGVKPGITRATTPDERRIEIERAAGLPVELVAVWRIADREDARFVEGQVLKRLRNRRTFGEWHAVDQATVIEAIEEAMKLASVSGAERRA